MFLFLDYVKSVHSCFPQSCIFSCIFLILSLIRFPLWSPLQVVCPDPPSVLSGFCMFLSNTKSFHMCLWHLRITWFSFFNSNTLQCPLHLRCSVARAGEQHIVLCLNFGDCLPAGASFWCTVKRFLGFLCLYSMFFVLFHYFTQ